MSKANIYVIREYIKKYSSDITLGELIRSEIGNKFKCPKCKGRGEVWIEDGFGDGRTGNYYTECDLCKGKGYTDKEYKPRYIQDGYEEV